MMLLDAFATFAAFPFLMPLALHMAYGIHSFDTHDTAAAVKRKMQETEMLRIL